MCEEGEWVCDVAGCDVYQECEWVCALLLSGLLGYPLLIILLRSQTHFSGTEAASRMGCPGLIQGCCVGVRLSPHHRRVHLRPYNLQYKMPGKSRIAPWENFRPVETIGDS